MSSYYCYTCSREVAIKQDQCPHCNSATLVLVDNAAEASSYSGTSFTQSSSDSKYILWGERLAAAALIMSGVVNIFAAVISDYLNVQVEGGSYGYLAPFIIDIVLGIGLFYRSKGVKGFIIFRAVMGMIIVPFLTGDIFFQIPYCLALINLLAGTPGKKRFILSFVIFGILFVLLITTVLLFLFGAAMKAFSSGM